MIFKIMDSLRLYKDNERLKRGLILHYRFYQQSLWLVVKQTIVCKLML